MDNEGSASPLTGLIASDQQLVVMVAQPHAPDKVSF